MSIQPLDFEQPLIDLENCLTELTTKSPSDHQKIDDIREKLELMRKDLYQHLTPWQRIQIARHPARPYALDYVEQCFSNFIELHGDRLFGDDQAMPAGLAKIGNHHCVVLMQQKGRSVKENIKRTFGSPHPEGYRKALRLMQMAEKFSLPVVAFIDTPGAYPGIGAEERHIAEAIAVNLREMMLLKTPILSIIIGEGGSGGALGIGVADRVLMMENSYYSVISPEGCAAILWKHRNHRAEAAEALKLTAADLTEFELVDGVIPEPMGGAHRNPQATMTTMSETILATLDEIIKVPMDKLLQQRYAKFRKMGVFEA